MPEQATEPQGLTSSAISSTSHDFSTVSEPLPEYEQTMWPAPHVDWMSFGGHPDTFPETLLYNGSLDLNSEPLSYAGSYTPCEYLSARTMTTDLQIQAYNGQSLDLDPQFDFVTNYQGVGLDEIDDRYKDLGASGNQLLSGDILDTPNSSIWMNDSSSQDLGLLGIQFDNHFAAQVDDLSYPQVQCLILSRN